MRLRTDVSGSGIASRGATPKKNAFGRFRALWLVAFAVLIGGAGLIWANMHRNQSQKLEGAAFLNIPAYDFRLTDQDGRPVALTDFRGKSVALTFLYVHCPDVCPL